MVVRVKILMIEDNESVCEMMGMFFENEGYEASFYHDGEEGWLAYQENPRAWDIVVLDLNLPSMDGLVICRKIREISKETPIIMLTARDSESSQVIGLEMGADDYVTKPFSPVALMARLKALYRRSQLGAAGSTSADGEDIEDSFDIVAGEMKINTQTREVVYYNEPLPELTPKEFDLLALMADSPRRVFTRNDLLTTLWEDPFYGDERTVDAHIKKLRHKIEQNGPQVIQTVWGVGYKYEEAGEE